MLGKVIVQGISGLLLLGAATMFVSGAQSGALRQTPASAPAAIAAAEPALQSAPLDLF